MKSQTRTLAAVIAIVVILAGAGGVYYQTQTKTMPPPVEQMPQPEKKITKVTFIFDWRYEGRHAPYFVALDKGWYKEAGIDVEFVPGRGTPYAIQVLTSGKADIGMAAASGIITARARGIPIKAVAMMFQSDPMGIFTLPESGIKKLQDLVGKKLGVRTFGADYAEWSAMMAKIGLKKGDIQEIPLGVDPVAPLLAGQVDASIAWEENGWEFKEKGQPQIVFIPFRDQGINFYVTGIFASDEYLQKNQELVRNFLKASLMGWKYAIDHPGESVDILLKYNRDLTYDREINQLLLATRTRVISLAVKTNGLGYMEAARWTEMQDILFEYKVIEKKSEVSSMFMNDFLPKPPMLP